MCVHFFNFDHLRIILQSSDLIWGTKFRAPSLPLPPLIFYFLQALINGFLWWWASSWRIFSLKWVSNHLLSPFRCHSSSRSKGLHWWRRFKAYKLHMELHHSLCPITCHIIFSGVSVTPLCPIVGLSSLPSVIVASYANDNWVNWDRIRALLNIDTSQVPVSLVQI